MRKWPKKAAQASGAVFFELFQNQDPHCFVSFE